ncbi:MAG: hypothetical protein KF898_00235 [Parachlamydiales bacterium]|nr:hypothetical protein [Verrucomicrobiota bacterium]MBX3718059.1 hypothetical protein [Candidatus Acheromyda pituitae]
MSQTVTFTTFNHREEHFDLTLRSAGDFEDPGIPHETLSKQDVVNIALFTKTVQWCLRQDDVDSKLALETMCEQIVDCPNVLANVQYLLPLISEYLHVAERSPAAREELIRLTDRSLEVLTKLAH